MHTSTGLAREADLTDIIDLTDPDITGIPNTDITDHDITGIT